MALALKKESSSPNPDPKPKPKPKPNPNPSPNPNPNPNPNLEEGVEQLGRRDGGHRRHSLLHGRLLLDALRLVIG